jgi:RNA-directed DNA polymerase
MKESYGEGVATHTGPESCAIARKSDGEALTGGRAGQVLSREIHDPRRKPGVLRGADAVEEGGRLHLPYRQREIRKDPARSETLCTHRHISHGNREIPRLSPAEGAGDRIGKSKDARR